MCMQDDDSEQLTCYDEQPTAAEQPSEITPQALTKSPKICPKCLIFWVVIAVLVFTILWKRSA